MSFRGNHANSTIDTAIRQLTQAYNETVKHHHSASRVVDGIMGELDENITRVVGIIGEQDTRGGGKIGKQIHDLMVSRDQKRRQAKQKLGIKREELARAVEVFQADRKQHQAAQMKMNDARKAAVDRMDQLPQWQQAREQLDNIEEQLGHAQQRAGQAHEDLSTKAPEYRKDVIFNYLLERGFGEPDKSAESAMVRWMDSWAASLINYREQIINYRKILLMPQALDEHVAKIRQQREQIIREHELSADQAWAAWPNAKEMENLAASAGERMNASQRARDKLTRQVDSLDAELGAFAEGEDYYSVQINTMLVGLFENGGRAAKALVEATESTEDDAILENIKNLQEELKKSQKLASKAWDEVSMAQKKLDQAQNFRRKFKQKRLGGSDRTFTRMRSNDLLNAIILGQALDSVLNNMSRHSRVDTPSYSSSSSRSSSWGSSGGFGSGGGFGGGGFGSGGGFGGGGFKTGGGF